MPSAAGLTQMITIVDKSNKVVGSSKQLKNVFTEAKLAYLERRAEIKAHRKMKEENELQKAIRAMSIVDEEERGSIVSRSQTHRHYRTRETREHRRSAEYSHHDRTASEHPRCRASPTHSPRSSDSFEEPARGQMIRRSKTDVQLQPRRTPVRTNSTPDIDLDLAYGEYHDEDLRSLSLAPTASRQLTPQQQEKQLGTLVQKCQVLLDEANCAQYSVRKMVMHLQDNPDAMAAVALTLAEISNVAAKLAPGALTAFRASAPAVLALLASPQFLIAVGVGLGVTVVMFGGYKIIKKIQAGSGANSQENLIPAANGQARSQSMDEMLDVRELDRIEQWRRGIADVQVDQAGEDGRTEVSSFSAATSVEGEFISPFAARSMGHLPLPTESSRSKKPKKEHKKTSDDHGEREHKKKHRKHRDRDRDRDQDTASVTSSHVSRSSSTRGGSEREKQAVKVKKPSPLRRMFAPGTSVRV